MPDSSGKLSDEEKKKITDWLARWRHEPNPCSVCGSPNWLIGDHLVQPVTLGPNSQLQLGGVGYPQIMLISLPCGHTVFINAVVAGILVPPPPVPPPPPFVPPSPQSE